MRFNRPLWIAASICFLSLVAIFFFLAAAFFSGPATAPGIHPGELVTDHAGGPPWVSHDRNELIAANGVRVPLLSGGRLAESPKELPTYVKDIDRPQFPVYVTWDDDVYMVIGVRDGTVIIKAAR